MLSPALRHQWSHASRRKGFTRCNVEKWGDIISCLHVCKHVPVDYHMHTSYDIDILSMYTYIWQSVITAHECSIKSLPTSCVASVKPSQTLPPLEVIIPWRTPRRSLLISRPGNRWRAQPLNIGPSQLRHHGVISGASGIRGLSCSKELPWGSCWYLVSWWYV